MTVATLLAHGSPDPRHARDVRALARRVSAAGLPAQVAFLEHDDPRPADLARTLADGGARATVVVPLLVGPAHHARVDVPVSVAAMRSAAPSVAVHPADPIGLHPLVLSAAEELVITSHIPVTPRTGVILAAAGSRDRRAAEAVEVLVDDHAAALAGRLGVPQVRAALLDGGPALAEVRGQMLRSDGCAEVLVVTLVVADGILRDRIVTTATGLGMTVIPGALADTEALARLVDLRVRAGRTLREAANL
jgi:sirohydrochlorin ferrochelatase